MLTGYLPTAVELTSLKIVILQLVNRKRMMRITICACLRSLRNSSVPEQTGSVHVDPVASTRKSNGTEEPSLSCTSWSATCVTLLCRTLPSLGMSWTETCQSLHHRQDTTGQGMWSTSSLPLHVMYKWCLGSKHNVAQSSADHNSMLSMLYRLKCCVSDSWSTVQSFAAGSGI